MTAPRFSPRILRPFSTGGREVWVSGVPVNATVTIAEGQEVTGEVRATEPVLAVSVRPVGAPVTATVRSGDQVVTTEDVWPLLDPSEVGPYPDAAHEDVDCGRFTVPTHTSDEGEEGGYDVDLRGRFYLPANPGGDIPDRVRNVPLVIIAHGYWGNERGVDEVSHHGYGWLAEHLARWGMAICSVDLSAANRETESGGSAQYSRGEIILAMIECLLGNPLTARFLDRDRIGLVGHSMGGEGVVFAQELNQGRDAPYGIRGVTSLAPTNYRPDVACRNTAYQLMHGSADYLLGYGRVTGGDEAFNGFRLHDRAWRPRSLAWIRGARHQPWNPIWFDDQSYPDDGPDPDLVLEPEHQRAIGRGLITAFFADILLGRSDYRGYLSGPMTPLGFGDAVVHRQYQAATVEPVDDYGDADDQFLLDAEDPLDRTVNRRGETVSATGAGLDRWEDVHHQEFPRSVHDTRGTDLAWINEDLQYQTGLGRMEVDVDSWLSIRVVQHYDEADEQPDETWNRCGEELDLLVELADGRRRAAVRLGAVETVPYLLPGWKVFSVFQTVRLPMDAFVAVEPALDITALQQIRLRPVTTSDTSGRILIDDIEFETTRLTAPSTIAMLRAHELGTGYGPPTDLLDTEMVVQLTERPGETFGLRLRNDDQESVAQGMLAMLRAAMVTRTPVILGYEWSGPTVRKIVRVARTR